MEAATVTGTFRARRNSWCRSNVDGEASSASRSVTFGEESRGWNAARRSVEAGEESSAPSALPHNQVVDALDHIVNRSASAEPGKLTRSLTRSLASQGRLDMGGVAQAVAEVAGSAGAGTPWYIMHPHTNFMSAWEILGAFILLVIALFTPFEVAYMDTSLGLFIFGRVVDFYFVVDMCMNFFIMVPKVGDPGKLETRHSVIVVAYLQGWFLLDVFSLSASIVDILPVAMGWSVLWQDAALANNATTAMGQDLGAYSALEGFRVVRVLRLIKLLRLVKASRIIKSMMTKIATPRATVTFVSATAEVVYVSHLFACFLALTTIFPPTQLDTWFATLGYCRPMVHNEADHTVEADEGGEQCREIMQINAANGVASNSAVDGRYCSAECASPGYLYLQAMWWSLGLFLGAPISLTPNRGPHEPFFYAPDHLTLLTPSEQMVVLVLKCATAFMWASVIARFVQVYNNLDPDARDFRMGWDALNRFVSYFKVPKADALELRRYYIERAEEAKAKSRKRVMNEFSPMLAEKFVWKLNKDWLVRVPCFTLVVQRLMQKPESGMERFLVKVALAMQPAVYVPTERPPAHRLYIVTHGVAIHKGSKRAAGSSWGAEDVFLTSYTATKHCHRAIATTYLHVLYVGADVFVNMKDLGHEYRAAFLLTKLWATIYATGSAILEQHRMEVKARKIRVGSGLDDLSAEDVERRINKGLTSVIPLRGPDGEVLRDERGRELHRPKYGFLAMGNFEIVKTWASEAAKFMYRVKQSGPGVPAEDEVERIVRNSHSCSASTERPVDAASGGAGGPEEIVDESGELVPAAADPASRSDAWQEDESSSEFAREMSSSRRGSGEHGGSSSGVGAERSSGVEEVVRQMSSGSRGRGMARAKSSGLLLSVGRSGGPPPARLLSSGGPELEKLSRELAAATSLVRSQSEAVNAQLGSMSTQLGSMGSQLGSLSKRVDEINEARRAEVRAAASRMEQLQA